MSVVKVYQREQKGKEFGSSMEKKEPSIRNVHAPETPVKLPPLPARPQLVYVRRRSGHDTEIIQARIETEEARDPICAIITAATFTTKNGDSNNSSMPVDDCKYLHTADVFQIDSNKSIYDFDENSAASVHGSQAIGDSGEGLFKEGFQSVNHDLLSIPDLEESENSKDRSYDKKQHGLISHMNDEKLDRIECSKPVEPVMISIPLPKRSGNKRPNNGIDKNKKPAKKPETKKHRAKVAVEGKPKRTPKKMTKPSTPNEKRKCVKKTLPIRRSQESSVTEDHKEVAEIPKTENLPVDDKRMAMVSNVNRDLKDDNKMAMVSNVNHELKDDNRLGLDSTMQDGMDKKSGAMVLLNGFDLGFDSNQNELRWNVRALRSVGEYWPKPGCHQYNSLQAYKRIFKVDSCLSNSRRVVPSVLKRCMKKRMKRRRKLNMFSALGSSDHFRGHVRKKRSEMFTRRVDFTSLIAGFAEIDEVLVTAPRDHIAVLEEQELQITDKVKGENLESLTEDCIEVGLSLDKL
ncbi:uncharacterized protein LOC133701238 [Populus nigra]|uniref:uncharacterized protein LOC133701238 n=1 Tax=Populus nigra TaxID=3691 RepID=UPI002B265B3C|nr:uncharacterized protein LOC133701238 [Populus nigra]XP_061981065.1 uncharacterized protein LOC133701238 [Populus nigra]XP_061981066.1 uncharacterized protein LOC133701238 [Populus nigra]XP_061981067.1 uncharacterized protein LOC133701238 [Populus nigra]XP_061981068.1 uncharacterized protein LOC133701238 [Populus nigra]